MWQLIINGPGYFDTAYDLPEGTTTVGRADENDIVLSGDLVSRRHVRIHARGDALTVEDLGSRNGCRLNGTLLEGTAPLQQGDTLSVGENTVAVRQPSTVEGASTELVDLGAGGVRRIGDAFDPAGAVVIRRDAHHSAVLRALDNVVPFANPFADDGPAPIAEQGPGAAASQAPADTRSVRALVLLYRAAESLSRAPSLQSFLDETTDRLLEVVDATTAVVLLRHASGAMVPAAVRHRGALARGEVPVSDGIIAAALAQGAALAISDVKDDARFNTRDSVVLYGADQVLCVPIGDQEPYAGVLYVNRSGEGEGDLAPLLDVCTAIAHLIATGVARFRGNDERGRREERLRRTLERFHPPDVLDRRVAELTKSPGATPERLEPRTATLLFVELVGLDVLARRGDPDAVLAVLNDFSKRVTAGMFSFEGTVQPLPGGGAMAVFGAPYPRGDDALRAVRAALALRQDWMRAGRLRPASQRLELRIGLHTGSILAGLAGEEPRLEYAVLGEAVHLAQAVCADCSPGQVLLSGKTLAAIGARFDVTPVGEKVLRGKEATALFEVLEEDVPLTTFPGR